MFFRSREGIGLRGLFCSRGRRECLGRRGGWLILGIVSEGWCCLREGREIVREWGIVREWVILREGFSIC
jgi:hypothetical protein